MKEENKKRRVISIILCILAIAIILLLLRSCGIKSIEEKEVDVSYLNKYLK